VQAEEARRASRNAWGGKAGDFASFASLRHRVIQIAVRKRFALMTQNASGRSFRVITFWSCVIDLPPDRPGGAVLDLELMSVAELAEHFSRELCAPTKELYSMAGRRHEVRRTRFPSSFIGGDQSLW
jgi:hypothetical protein